MMQEVEVLKTIPELVCSYFSEEQFTLSSEYNCLTLKVTRNIIGQCGVCQEHQSPGDRHNKRFDR